MIAKVPNLRRWVVNVAIPPQLAFETLDVVVVVVIAIAGQETNGTYHVCLAYHLYCRRMQMCI